jgi:hypothetical protein
MRIREGWKKLKHIFLVRRTRNSNQQGWIEREDPVDEDGRDRERRKKIEWKDNGLRYEGGIENCFWRDNGLRSVMDRWGGRMWVLKSIFGGCRTGIQTIFFWEDEDGPRWDNM